MVNSIEQRKREVQAAFDAAYRLADDGGTGPLQGFELAVWDKLLALGRTLVALYLARRAARPRAARYEHGGRTYELVGTETREVGTRFGKVDYDGPLGRVVGWKRAARDLPLDRELGLCSGFSLVVVTTLVKLCAQMAFGSARRTFHDVFQWVPSPRAVLRMVDGLGGHARSFLEQAPAPEDDGEVLVIQVDGKGAPAIGSREYTRRRRPRRKSGSTTKRHRRRARRREYPRPRRVPGNKSKNAKMATVGVLYTLRRTPDGLEGPINKRVYATFKSSRALFEWIKEEAVKRGYESAKFAKVVFIADGAKVLWKLQQEFFPDVTVCLDWYHVVEKIWAAGKCLHREGSAALAAWVAMQKRRLRLGQVDAVLGELRTIVEQTPRTGPGNKHRRKTLAKTLKHFVNNVERMRYHRLRREDIDIGSGIVEGAVRHVIGQRIDGPGMRWGLDRMEAVLLLRCILVNGQWEDFVRFLAVKQQVALPAQPAPTRTHDAKTKKAA